MAAWLWTDSARLVILAGLCILLTAVEPLAPFVVFPRARRQHYVPNLVLTGLLVLSNLALAALPTAASLWSTKHEIGLLAALPWNLPPVVMFLTAVVGLDFMAYWAHRTLHLTRLGWRFHAVHHSEAYVDVTTSFRQHPIETAWRTLFTAVGVGMLGAPLWCLAGYLTLSATNALLEHGNLGLPQRIDRWARLVFVTPNMHKVHHSREKVETNSNYSNIFSIWDRLFGSYHASPSSGVKDYGLDGYDSADAQTVRGLLIGPLIRST